MLSTEGSSFGTVRCVYRTQTRKPHGQSWWPRRGGWWESRICRQQGHRRSACQARPKEFCFSNPPFTIAGGGGAAGEASHIPWTFSLSSSFGMMRGRFTGRRPQTNVWRIVENTRRGPGSGVMPAISVYLRSSRRPKERTGKWQPDSGTASNAAKNRVGTLPEGAADPQRGPIAPEPQDSKRRGVNCARDLGDGCAARLISRPRPAAPAKVPGAALPEANSKLQQDAQERRGRLHHAFRG